MGIVQITGFVAGIFTSISLLPQLIKLVKERKTEAISVWMLVILLTGLGLWVAYGILIKDIPIIITNAVSFTLNVIIIILRIKYRSSKS